MHSCSTVAGGHVQGRKQRGRTMPFVVVGHGAGAPLLERQARLRTVQRLNLALLVDGEDHGVFRRIDVEPDDIAKLRRELRVVRDPERAHPVRLQTVGAPEPRNGGLVHPHLFRHQAGTPVRPRRRWGLNGPPDDLGFERGRNLLRTPRAGPVPLHGRQPFRLIARKPLADRRDTHAMFGRHLIDRHAVRGGQEHPGSLRHASRNRSRTYPTFEFRTIPPAQPNRPFGLRHARKIR